MAICSSLTVVYKGINSVGIFATIASQAGGGNWESVNFVNLLPEVCKDEAIEFVRVEIPAQAGELPPTGLGLVAEWTGTSGQRIYVKDPAPKNTPVFQMKAPDTGYYVFYIEYGRTHSRTR